MNTINYTEIEHADCNRENLTMTNADKIQSLRDCIDDATEALKDNYTQSHPILETLTRKTIKDAQRQLDELQQPKIRL